eukprot:scaffold302154_cov28-Tisochrysis_lutea.AAC.1
MLPASGRAGPPAHAHARPSNPNLSAPCSAHAPLPRTSLAHLAQTYCLFRSKSRSVSRPPYLGCPNAKTVNSFDSEL